MYSNLVLGMSRGGGIPNLMLTGIRHHRVEADGGGQREKAAWVLKTLAKQKLFPSANVAHIS